MSAALIIIAATIAGVLCLGLLARRGKDMDLEQWSVGGRGFGTILVFLLMAGEIYTTFTFLGGSGYAYGHGGPGVVYPVLRLPGLRDLLLAVANPLALRQATPTDHAARPLRPQI